jgi:hypothetical protein
MQKKSLVLVVMMTLLAWTGTALATPLILDHYQAYTKANINPFGDEYFDDDYTETPTAYAEAITPNTPEYAEAFAYCPSSDSLYASALSNYQGSGGTSASASMIAWKDQITISADLPQLHIHFEYYLYVKVDDTGSGSTNAGHAEASLHPTVVDYSPGSYGLVVWDLPDSLTLDNSTGTEIINTTSDTIDEVISLIPGHKYAISFSPFEVKAWAYDGQEAWAYGAITDIDLQLVPLPSTLLLASSGLLGLLALRRKRKF